ncbi:hypothetical protein [uncultured Desulfobacter sp.]|uniref:hypothetical protein n=1 Tax=uncultured Desulfobacter sp. TaxID=240139 RepID=UPI002AAA63C2|nr:hypothetical protein [uncultured Desulfobacter sp.]
MISLPGLPIYLDMVKEIDLSKSIQKYLKTRKDAYGWPDVQILSKLVLFYCTFKDIH